MINFRTMYDPAITFDEAEYLKNLHINYHPIPTGTRNISENNVQKFFNIIKEIRNSNGERKLHIHCKAGADRTGFFSLLYKTIYKIDSFENNAKEMVKMGHNQKLYPNLVNYAKEIVKKINTLKS